FDEGISLFARKKAPMFFIGSFVLAGPTAEIFTKPNVGVFLLPSWNPKVPAQATESSGNGWIVNSKTKNPALAADALNYLLFNPGSQRVLFEQVAADWAKLWTKARKDGETLSRTGLPRC